MCIEYTYSWPTFNGALVDEMSPNPVYFPGGACPQTPLAIACFDPPSYSMLRPR